MSVLKKIAIGVVALIVVLLLVGLALPRTWHVEQSVVINAAPSRIHPFVSNLKKWQDWAAWTRDMDPEVKWTYSGPESGVGASWGWIGPKMGRGRMVITHDDPAIGVKIDEAIESDEINAHGSLTYVAEGSGTKVVWVDEGELPPVVGGYFRGMINAMLTENFSVGLGKLKAAVEALPPEAAPVVPAPEPASPEGATDGGLPAEVHPAPPIEVG